MFTRKEIQIILLLLTPFVFTVIPKNVSSETMRAEKLPKFKRTLKSYFNVPFKSPQSLTIDIEHEELFLVDSGSNEILIFDLEGTPISKLGAKHGLFRPIDIAVRNNMYYISQSGKPYLEVFDFMGNSIKKLTIEGKKFSPGMLFNISDGNLYVINKQVDELVVFDSDDKFVRTIGTGDKRLISLTGAAIGTDRIYLFTPFNSDNAIHVYHHNGDYSHSFENIAASGGGGSLGLPIRGVVDEKQNLWIVDALRGVFIYNSKDKKINSFGQLEIGGKRKNLQYPIDIDFGLKNEVYLLEETPKLISIFR